MKSIYKSMAIAAAAIFTVGGAQAQLSLGTDCGCPDLASRTSVNLSTLTDANGNLPAAATTLTCDNTYMIDEKVYVPAGGQLYIQPGTVLRGVSGQTIDANALIVSRNGKIFANGTDCCPIIFTDENDPLDGSYSVDIRGQWGGLIILGNATNNLLLNDGDLAVGDGVGNIEGLVPGDSRNHYGGNDDNDSSGSLRYVSLRHGGTDIGEGNEINGLTLGSVGRGTTLEYIEVISNDDDGIEFFGGTVDLKYATVMFCNDDYFDWDQGWSGRGQFWYGVQLQGAAPQGDEGFESDGDDANSGNTPASNPTIYNVTLIGRGANRGIMAKEGTKGQVSNSIFSNFAAGVDLADEAGHPLDALANFGQETLSFSNNCFDVPTLLTVSGTAATGATLTAFQGAGNDLVPGVIDASFTIDPATNAVTGSLNPVPTVDVTSPEVAPVDDFFSGANYKGAFKPGATPWTSGWTLSQLLNVDNSIVDCPEDINTDGAVNVDDFLQLLGAFNTSCGL
ncbi:MAG: T9SS C-terminal target domain-containing protein [Bacteroidetes bacterium]|nr:T9SS C-terminal target domain-containing protein [Bacteroidota bacterium]